MPVGSATVRAYAERIVLMHGEEMIGDHPRFFGRGHVQYNPGITCGAGA